MVSVSYWLKQIFSHSEAIPRSGYMHYQYEISSLVSQTSFHGKTSSRVTTCQLFSPAKMQKQLRSTVPPFLFEVGVVSRAELTVPLV